MPSPCEVAFFFDTDALVQIFIAGQQSLLHILRQEFGVACFIMMEVEVELRSHAKLAGLIKPQLDRAIRNGWLKLLSSSDLEQTPCLQKSPAISLTDIRQLGAELELDVQTGEAYTHAAAILLGMPAISNDLNAIKVLEAKGKPLPPTILRSFDLFGFFHSEAYLDEGAVETVRKTLKGYGEWLPKSMRNSSFKDGLLDMQCRLSSSLALSGSGSVWSQPFYLKRARVN